MFSIQEDAVDKVKEVIEEDIWGTIQKILAYHFDIGSGDKLISLTVGHILLVVVAIILTKTVLGFIRRIFTRKMAAEDKLKFTSVFKFARYTVYLVVLLVTMSSAGVDITLLLTASAALFVGLGLALQELFQDIMGGIMIMLDKTLAVGDIIEVDGRVGRVFEIKLRTTRALTRDDKVIIIPNHKFISDTVFNYTQNHKTTREGVHVGVAYGSDTALVKDVLLKCAAEQSGILKNPKPFVLFENFGDSSLNFGVYFFVSDSFVDPRIKSELRFKIDARFRESKITIPFPQRDVHIFNAQPPVVPAEKDSETDADTSAKTALVLDTKVEAKVKPTRKPRNQKPPHTDSPEAK